MQLQYIKNPPEEFRDSIAQLYIDTLGDKLLPIMGDADRTRKFLAKTFSLEHCIAAFCNEKLVAVLGFRDNRRGSFDPKLKTLIGEYGFRGGAYRRFGLLLIGHPVDADELYIDGITVAAEMRGQGVGTQLIAQLENFALEKGIDKLSLYVVDANAKARALYKRLGFAAVKQQKVFPFNLIFKFPFKSAALMIKNINPKGKS